MTYYTIRITPDEVYPEDDVLNKLKDISNTLDSIIVAKESMPRLHFHLRIHTTMCRASVYKFKSKWFPNWKGRGNDVWSTHDCARCKKHEDCSQRGLMYICKDGDIVFHQGYTDDEIALAVEQGSTIKSQARQKRPSVADRIIKHGKWSAGVVPTGREVLDAMIRYYDSQDRIVPDRTEAMLHAISMKLNEAYRLRFYNEITLRWDSWYSVKK